MKKISFRIGSTDLQVLQELPKDDHKLSETVRTTIIKRLHANHEEVYQQIYAENRRRDEEILSPTDIRIHRIPICWAFTGMAHRKKNTNPGFSTRRDNC